MGCAGSKEFDTTELGARTVPFAAEQCFDGQAAPSTTGTYQSSLNVMKMQMDYSSLSGKAISVSGRAISLVNKEYEMIDHDGKRVSVTKGATLQMIPLQMQMRTLRFTPSYDGQVSEFASDDKDQAAPLYNFGKAVATHTAFGAEGEYGLYTSGSGEETTVMLTGKRLGGKQQRLLFFDSAGTCVAKAKQTDMMGKVITFEVAGGIDPRAVLALHGALKGGGAGGEG
mgnify:FL=1